MARCRGRTTPFYCLGSSFSLLFSTGFAGTAFALAMRDKTTTLGSNFSSIYFLLILFLEFYSLNGSFKALKGLKLSDGGFVLVVNGFSYFRPIAC
jgi:hypothetical protein